MTGSKSYPCGFVAKPSFVCGLSSEAFNSRQKFLRPKFFKLNPRYLHLFVVVALVHNYSAYRGDASSGSLPGTSASLTLATLSNRVNFFWNIR